MREGLLSIVQRLDSRLIQLKIDLPHWIDEFSKAQRPTPLLNSNLLLRYNNGVLSWLLEWNSSFKTQLEKLVASDLAFAQPTDITAEREKIFNRKRAELNTFLALWKRCLPKGIVEITYSPRMPATLALLATLKVIMLPHESACQWLMPQIKKIFLGFEDTDIKAYTENDNGDFLPWHFVLSQSSGDTLIDVMTTMDYVRDDRIAASIYFSEKCNTMRSAVENALGYEALNYHRALAVCYYEAITNKTCFAYHVAQLAAALQEISVTRMGAERAVPDSYHIPIEKFYQVWNKMDHQKRLTIGNLCLENRKEAFYTYLLILFASCPTIQLTTFELQHVKKNVETVRCCNVFSTVFLQFLSANPDWVNLSVTCESISNPVYTSVELKSFREKLESKINSVAYGFTCRSHLSCAIDCKMSSHYETVFQLSAILFLLDDQQLIEVANNNNVFCHDAQSALLFLNSLLLENRIKFFNAFYFQWKAYFFDAGLVALLFQLIPENAHQELCFILKDKITSFFSAKKINAIFTDLYKTTCAIFSLDAVIVIQSFVKCVLSVAPDFIAEIASLKTCIYALNSEDDFQFILDKLGLRRVAFLFLSPIYKRGSVLLELIDSLKENNTSALSPLSFCVEDAVKVLLHNILPLLLEKNFLEDLCSATLLCNICFFSFKFDAKQDGIIFGKLKHIDQCVELCAITKYAGSAYKAFLLRDFIEGNERSQFLSALKKCFCENFFNTVCRQIEALKYHDPVLHVLPCAL